MNAEMKTAIVDSSMSVGSDGRLYLYLPINPTQHHGWRINTKVKAAQKGDTILVERGVQTEHKLPDQFSILRYPGREEDKLIVFGPRVNLPPFGLSPCKAEMNGRSITLHVPKPENRKELKKGQYHRRGGGSNKPKLSAHQNDVQALEAAVKLINRAVDKNVARIKLRDDHLKLIVTTTHELE